MPRGKMSAEGRAKIAAAARKRWARVRELTQSGDMAGAARLTGRRKGGVKSMASAPDSGIAMRRGPGRPRKELPSFASIVENAAPNGRRRGRPRKQASSYSAIGGNAAPNGRRRGRPRKSLTAPVHNPYLNMTINDLVGAKRQIDEAWSTVMQMVR